MRAERKTTAGSAGGGGGGAGGGSGSGGGSAAAAPQQVIAAAGGGDGGSGNGISARSGSIAGAAQAEQPAEAAGRRDSLGRRRLRRKSADAPPAPEVFAVVARGVQAQFRGIQWAAKQETFPYGSGTGTADAMVVNGSVRIGFSLKRGTLGGVEGPLLVMSSRTITMEALTVSVANTRLAWLLNLLVSLFSETIKEYVCRSLKDTLDENASELLGAVNGFAAGSWPLLLSAAKLDAARLPPASAAEEAVARGERAAAPKSGGALRPPRLPPLPPLDVVEGDGQLRGLIPQEFSLVLEEQGPLGMQIDIVELPGGGRRLLVAGLVPGAQAERQLGSAASEVVGSELVGLGSERLDDRPLEHCLTLLRDAPRPVKIVVRRYLPERLEDSSQTPADVIRVSFTDQSLGLRFKPSPLHGPTATEIAGFARAPDGTERVAEACGQVAPGQVLWAINGNRVLGVAFQQVVQQLKGLPRPIEFALLDVPDVQMEFTAPPLDLRLQYMQGHMVVTDIVKVESPLCEKLQEGHVLLTVNGLSLPSPHGKYDKDVAMLNAPTMYPLKLRFARDNSVATGATPPGSPGSDNGAAAAATAAAAAAADGYLGSGYVTSYKRSMGRAVEVTVADPEDMAMTFDKGKDGRPRIKAFALVDGPARHSNRVQVGMVLMAINGVPLSKKANTCASCRQLLAATPYPATITFRNMSAFLAAAQRL